MAKLIKILFLIVAIGVVTTTAISLAQEEIILTTIMPSQDQDMVRGKDGAIGPTYMNYTDAQVNDGNLIVEGRVGIGTSDPDSRLHVTSNIVSSGGGIEGGQITLKDGDGNSNWEIDNYGGDGNEDLRFFRSTFLKAIIKESSEFLCGLDIDTASAGKANIRLGADTANNDIEIGSTNGAISMVSFWNSGYLNYMDAQCRDIWCRDVYYSGQFKPVSSREYKKDIRLFAEEEYKDALEKLLNTDVVHFRYKNSEQEERIGIITEDAPDEITDEEKKGLYTADSIAMLLAALKAQQKQIEQLKTEIKSLK